MAAILVVAIICLKNILWPVNIDLAQLVYDGAEARRFNRNNFFNLKFEGRPRTISVSCPYAGAGHFNRLKQVTAKLLCDFVGDGAHKRVAAFQLYPRMELSPCVREHIQIAYNRPLVRNFQRHILSGTCARKTNYHPLLLSKETRGLVLCNHPIDGSRRVHCVRRRLFFSDRSNLGTHLTRCPRINFCNQSGTVVFNALKMHSAFIAKHFGHLPQVFCEPRHRNGIRGKTLQYQSILSSKLHFDGPFVQPVAPTASESRYVNRFPTIPLKALSARALSSNPSFTRLL